MGGNPGGIGPVVNQLAHLVVDEVGIVVVEIVGLNGHTHMHLLMGDAQQLLNILPGAGRNGHHGYAQEL